MQRLILLQSQSEPTQSIRGVRPSGTLDGDSVSSDEAADIASQSSIWEKLEPPKRMSPLPTMSARLKQASPPPVPG